MCLEHTINFRKVGKDESKSYSHFPPHLAMAAAGDGQRAWESGPAGWNIDPHHPGLVLLHLGKIILWRGKKKKSFIEKSGIYVVLVEDKG